MWTDKTWIMNIFHDKLLHPAEETQPRFSLISKPSPTSLKEFLLLFCCILSSAHFIFVLMFIDPWPQHKYCGRVMEGWRWEREHGTETGGNYWQHESGESWASPQELSLQFHPWPNQKTTNPVWSCVAEGSQHLHLSQTCCLFMQTAIIRANLITELT